VNALLLALVVSKVDFCDLLSVETNSRLKEANHTIFPDEKNMYLPMKKDLEEPRKAQSANAFRWEIKYAIKEFNWLAFLSCLAQ